MSETKENKLHTAVPDCPGTVMLGDQSPWAGGINRFVAVSAELSNVRYFVQDADAPWKHDGSKIEVRQGWTDYWSIAGRHPFSLETPTAKASAMQQSLNTPRGLSYIRGPQTTETISSPTAFTEISPLLDKILMEEAVWATRLAEWSGNRVGVSIGTDLQHAIDLDGCRNPVDKTRQVAGWTGVQDKNNIGSLVGLFRETPVSLAEILPHNHYWVIDNTGQRRKFEGEKLGKEEVLVPAGKALPLEIAARGDTLGFTGLGYLDTVKSLRDKYTPHTPLNLLQVEFEWRVEPDPMEVMKQVFKEKKAARNQPAIIPDDELAQVERYWQGRPTSISTLVLGGLVEPRYTRVTI